MANIVLDCCLIYLPKPYLKEPDAQAPLGLMYIAAYMESKGRKVEIKNYSAYSYKEAIEDLPLCFFYGITATSLEIPQANTFAKLIKAKYQFARVVVGGTGTYSEEFIDYKYIDSIVQGDGEKTAYKILIDIENQIPLKKTYQGIPITKLDELPLPARHLLKNKQGGNIFAYGQRYADGDSTIILSSRGCPFKCAFCSAPFLTYQNKVRFRNPDKVALEIRHVKEKYGIKQFRFSDDMFTASKKRVLQLCEQIEKENVYWRISCRVDNLDEEMLDKMYWSGCRELSFGIESFDDKVLKGLNKKATAEQNRQALELAHKYKFKTRILLMIRTPLQTPETIELNKKYLLDVPYDIIACTGFIPIPGCDVWNNPDKYNIEILNRDLDLYNFYMFGPEGRRPLDKIFKIKDRCIDEFHNESESFRDWLEKTGTVNLG